MNKILCIACGKSIDAASGTVSSAPLGNGASLDKNITFTAGSSDVGTSGQFRRIGLGIDAGGTYTDAVIFDFRKDRVVAKAKALTTKWRVLGRNYEGGGFAS